MSVNVSFIIASCRHPSIIKKTIDAINSLEQYKYSYEILVYSPTMPYSTHENVTWFKEDELRGPHYGFNFLANRTQGEYIYQLVDDMAICSDGWNAISFLESPIFRDRKYKVTTLNTRSHQVRCGWPLGYMSREAAPADAELIPDHLCMRFPVMHRSFLGYTNGWFYHPELYYHQADAWLGYWIGETGEPGLECDNAAAVLHTHGQITHAHDVSDTNKYFDLIRHFQSGEQTYVRGGARNEL